MSSYAEYVVGRRAYGRLTQTFGTVIRQMIEPWDGALTQVASLLTTTSTTAHILTLMRPFARTTFSAVGAGTQQIVNINADPGAYGTSTGLTLATTNNAIAGSDVIVYQAADGTFVLDTVSSVATLAITMTTNLPTCGVKAGDSFWFFGIETDTNPNNNAANPRWNLNASTVNVWGRGDGMASIPGLKGLGLDNGVRQPLVLSIDNGTAASIIEGTGVEYLRRASA